MSKTLGKGELEPDIIDNRNISMSDVLNSNLARIGYLDISSGYFDVSGYGMIRQQLENATRNNNFKLRLLLGKNAINPPEYETFEEYQNRAKSIKDELDSKELDKDSMTNVVGLIKLLNKKNVHVRHNDHKFNHSKCYILGNEGAIVGSSNFTYSGFHGNYELNVGIYQTGTWEKIKEWYDRMWNKSSNAKEDMIQVLKQSKFGIPAAPYDVYIKMLFEMYKPALLAIEKEEKPERKSKLANFQKDAVSTAVQIISAYGGVFIADATGLGKTHMGIEIMHQKVHGDRRRILLVAPAQVLNSVWSTRLRDAGIAAETVSIEKLGRKNFLEKYPGEARRYAKCDLVVVDESQKLKSKNANSRRNLMRIMSFERKKKQAVLLSATPINNSIMDLYYQLSIITGQNDSYFWDIGIPNLYRHMMSAATKGGLSEGLEKIHQILNITMVRRTRFNIKDMYGDNAMLNGRPIKFPSREYQPIKYGISDTFGDIYSVLTKAIKSLKMTPYGIKQYKKKPNQDEQKNSMIIASLQVIHMLKRFESSTEAVRISIDNKIKLYEYFEKVLKKNRIFSVKQFNKIMIKLKNSEDDSTEEENENFFMSEIERIPTCSAKDYDINKIQKDVESDLIILKGLRNEIAKMVNLHIKFNTVARTIHKDKALEMESKKVLIFTEYADTAKYLEKMVKETFDNKSTLLITGRTKSEKRQEYIERFAPVANLESGKLPKDMENADILISTEVLAEGQNLQDCNYVINYDLPWNPMRIVQRIGRIDRLTSSHNTVHSRACFPEDNLDDLLNLVGTLVRKINTAGAVIGLDGEVLGEPSNPNPSNKSIFDNSRDRIKILAGFDSSKSFNTLQTLENEDELMPDASFNEISKYIRDEGIKDMKAAPMGRRSGKKCKTTQNATKAILAYIIEDPRRFYTVAIDRKNKTSQDTLDYFGKKYQARMVDDNTEAMREVACIPNTPKHLPDDSLDNHKSFEMLLEFDRAARGIIKKRLESNALFAVDEMDKRHTAYNKIIKEIKSKITNSIRMGKITKEQGRESYDIIKSNELRPWESRLKEIYNEYADDIVGMLEQLNNLGKTIGIFEGLGQDEDYAPVTPDVADLKLVGAMFLSD